MNYNDLVGVSDIAEICGVTPPAVNNWRLKWDDFPKPVRVLHMGPIYSWKQIERCLKRHPKCTLMTRT